MPLCLAPCVSDTYLTDTRHNIYVLVGVWARACVWGIWSGEGIRADRDFVRLPFLAPRQIEFQSNRKHFNDLTPDTFRSDWNLFPIFDWIFLYDGIFFSEFYLK